MSPQIVDELQGLGLALRRDAKVFGEQAVVDQTTTHALE